jgi:hypothetical protein
MMAAAEVRLFIMPPEKKPRFAGPFTAAPLILFFFAREYALEWLENQLQNESFKKVYMAESYCPWPSCLAT